MMESKPRDITMKSFLNNAVDETLISASIPNRIRMALENVPEWVRIPESDKQACIEFVAQRVPAEVGNSTG